MRAVLLAGVFALGWGGAAYADLITNGNFESTYSLGTASSSTPSQLNYHGYGVSGWTSSRSDGYNFLFNPFLAGSAGYTSNGQYGDIQLYVASNGGSATAPGSLVSPNGGNFIAADGAFQQGPISQVIPNLTIGDQYRLTFYWAGAQQKGFSGMTTESWGVTFGNQSFSTSTATTPDKGFTPWTQVSYVFTATSVSQTLSFLASGGPTAAPSPFTLLDGVTLNDVTPAPSSVPEPTTLALLGTSMLGVAALRRRRSPE